MGIEIPNEYGGSGAPFFTSILTIEELSRHCPGVSSSCDLQNMLVNRFVMRLGTTEQKHKYLPKLATEYVSIQVIIYASIN